MKIIAFRERNAIESFISGVARASRFFPLPPREVARRAYYRGNHSPDKHTRGLARLRIVHAYCHSPPSTSNPCSLSPAQHYSDRQTILHNICLHGRRARVLSTGNCDVATNFLPLSNGGSFVHFILIPTASLQRATATGYDRPRVKGFALRYVLIFIELRFLSSYENDSYYLVHLTSWYLNPAVACFTSPNTEQFVEVRRTERKCSYF